MTLLESTVDINNPIELNIYTFTRNKNAQFEKFKENVNLLIANAKFFTMPSS